MWSDPTARTTTLKRSDGPYDDTKAFAEFASVETPQHARPRYGPAYPTAFARRGVFTRGVFA
eukprot:768348-Prorocentrum_minimum.AAC.1